MTDLNRLPDPGAGFSWETHSHGSGDYPVLRPVVDGVAAAFTTRLGGVSLPPLDSLNVSMALGDHPARVFCNRDLAARTIEASWMWSTVRQVHGSRVVPAAPGHRKDADGVWTDDPDVTVAIVVADCVPVLAVGDRGIVVAHAGWRGLLEGVVENAIASVDATVAFAGPAIGPCCFEVRDDVSEPLRERFGANVMTDDRHADLWAAAKTAAAAAGAELACSRICTSCHPELLFSHRRDYGETGRQAVVARRCP